MAINVKLIAGVSVDRLIMVFAFTRVEKLPGAAAAISLTQLDKDVVIKHCFLLKLTRFDQ